MRQALALFNRQRKKRVDLVSFRAFAEPALAKVRKLATPVTLPEEINVVFVSDARISEIHRDFMSVQGPTDVITFRHGEIIISVETAERQAQEFSTSFSHELALYFVHGLLHLAGWDDLTDDGCKKMDDSQERIVEEVVSSQWSVVSKEVERLESRIRL
jgi:probable rRNA maturation factor